MRLAAVLKWAGFAVAVPVAAVVALLYSVDVDSYRGEIAEEFRKATGRELGIDGGIDLSISLSPAVVIEKVAVANAGWGSRTTMATVERAEAQVEPIPPIAGDTVAVRGAVDLASETLRLTVEPRAKTVTLNVAVPVHVRGMLAQPSFRPDTGPR